MSALASGPRARKPRGSAGWSRFAAPSIPTPPPSTPDECQTHRPPGRGPVLVRRRAPGLRLKLCLDQQQDPAVPRGFSDQQDPARRFFTVQLRRRGGLVGAQRRHQRARGVPHGSCWRRRPPSAGTRAEAAVGQQVATSARLQVRIDDLTPSKKLPHDHAVQRGRTSSPTTAPGSSNNENGCLHHRPRLPLPSSMVRSARSSSPTAGPPPATSASRSSTAHRDRQPDQRQPVRVEGPEHQGPGVNVIETINRRARGKSRAREAP